MRRSPSNSDATMRRSRRTLIAMRGAAGLRLGVVACLLLVLCCWCGAGHAAAAGTADDERVDREKASKVKAAILFNFAKFVTWPDGVFAGDGANGSIVIGVVNDKEFAEVVKQTVAGKKVGERAVEVRVIAGASEKAESVAAQIGRCQIVYVGAMSIERWRAVHAALEATGSPAVLTVGDDDAFAERGGMIEFVLLDGKITLQVNRDAAEASKLKISANLLKLATIVKTTSS